MCVSAALSCHHQSDDGQSEAEPRYRRSSDAFRETTDLDTEPYDTLNRVVQEYRQRMRDAREAAPEPMCLEDTTHNSEQAVDDNMDVSPDEGCQR